MGCEAGGQGAAGSASAGDPAATSDSALASSSAPPPAPAKVRRWPTLKPDTSAALPELSGEIPGIEADLARELDMRAIWLPENEANLRLLLTALSSAMRTGSFYGPLMTTLGEEKNRSVKQAAIKLWTILARQPTLPSNFSDQLEDFLARIATQPNHGVWKEGDPLHDFAALAAWFRRDDPEYVREFIRAADKNDQWPHAKSRHPMLRSKFGAISWLADMKAATKEEIATGLASVTHKLKEPFTVSSFKVALVEVSRTQQIGTEVPASGASFVVVRYTVENLGQQPTSDPKVEVAITDAKGRTFTPSFQLRVAMQMEDLMRGQRSTVDYQPGVAAPALQVFELPTDAAKGALNVTAGVDNEFGVVVVEGR